MSFAASGIPEMVAAASAAVCVLNSYQLRRYYRSLGAAAEAGIEELQASGMDEVWSSASESQSAVVAWISKELDDSARVTVSQAIQTMHERLGLGLQPLALSEGFGDSATALAVAVPRFPKGAPGQP